MPMEVVLVTQRELFDVIRRSESFHRLEKQCEARLVPMDDLMSFPAYYGLTITWSLFRGFADLGEAMTTTWLLFLNSDFILADGSYRSLVARLSGERRIVLAPSYCTIEEEVLPLLRQRLAPNGGTLAIAPREMADLMMDRLHYTVLSKTINRRMCRIERVDQLYYAVDHDTLVCRQFPIAIVAMKPERVLTEPVSIWDYGTISEACPTSTLTVLDDSDEFLMLELRERRVASDQLELGWLDPSVIARDHSIWTTADQRRCGEHTLVLHRRDLPPNLEAGRHALAEFHARIVAKVRQPALSHRNHPIWNRLQTLHHEWRESGEGRGGQPGHAWAMQASRGRPLGERIALAVRGAYRFVFGRIPHVRSSHPYWVDAEAATALIDREAARTRRAVAIWSSPRAIVAPWLKEWFDDVREYRTHELAGSLRPGEHAVGEPVDFCFVELERDEMLGFRDFHLGLRRMVRTGGRIVVLYRTHGVEALAPRDVNFILGALPRCDAAVVSFRGSPVLSGLQRLWDGMLAGISRRRRIGSLRFVLTALLVAPLTCIANWTGRRRAGNGKVPRGCTSVLMDITVL
jgi:hypothetical protein